MSHGVVAGKECASLRATRGNGLVIGLTGGIASGKSSVLSWLADQGCPVCDSDKLAREVVFPGEPALDRIVAEFGEGILLPGGNLDRKKLGEIVFADAAAREKLNAIVHPAVVDRLSKAVAEYRQISTLNSPDPCESALIRSECGNLSSSNCPLSIINCQFGDEVATLPLILDIPLLFEAQLAYLVDQSWLVWLPPELQLERLRRRDGLSETAAELRISSQMPLTEKRRLADLIIDNSGTWQYTEEQLRKALVAVISEARE